MKLKLSTRRVKLKGVPHADLWEALLRDEKKKIVWACGHAHFWRSGTSAHSISAVRCASMEKHRRENEGNPS